MTGRSDIEKRLQEAVQSYWDARAKNKEKQVESGKIDAGTRGEVTGGTQMGALEVLVADILFEAGLERLDLRTRTALELPGYFRPVFRGEPATPVSGAPKYKGVTYAQRYDLLCRRLVLERIYNASCFLMATNAKSTVITQPAADLTFARVPPRCAGMRSRSWAARTNDRIIRWQRACLRSRRSQARRAFEMARAEERLQQSLGSLDRFAHVRQRSQFGNDLDVADDVVLVGDYNGAGEQV